MPDISPDFIRTALARWANGFTAPVIEDEDLGDLSSLALEETLQKAERARYEKRLAFLRPRRHVDHLGYFPGHGIEVTGCLPRYKLGAMASGLRWTKVLFFQVELPKT